MASASASVPRKFQAFNAAGERIATAVLTKDNRIFQVYPLDKKTYYDTKASWLSSHPDAVEEKSAPAVLKASKKPKREFSLSVKYLRQMKAEFTGFRGYDTKTFAVMLPVPGTDEFMLCHIEYYLKDDFFCVYNGTFGEALIKTTSFKEIGCSSETPRLFHIPHHPKSAIKALPYIPINGPQDKETAYIIKTRVWFIDDKRLTKFNEDVAKLRAHLESKGFFVCVLSKPWFNTQLYMTPWYKSPNVFYVNQKVDYEAHGIKLDPVGRLSTDDMFNIKYTLPFTANFTEPTATWSQVKKAMTYNTDFNFFNLKVDELIAKI
jgi:hypothetical protein